MYLRCHISRVFSNVRPCPTNSQYGLTLCQAIPETLHPPLSTISLIKCTHTTVHVHVHVPYVCRCAKYLTCVPLSLCSHSPLHVVTITIIYLWRNFNASLPCLLPKVVGTKKGIIERKIRRGGREMMRNMNITSHVASNVYVHVNEHKYFTHCNISRNAKLS